MGAVLIEKDDRMSDYDPTRSIYSNAMKPGKRVIPAFDSVEQQRAWALTIEKSYQIINHMTIGAGGFTKIKQLADAGDPLAQAIMQKFIAIRMGG
jgi:hypothetical protein